MPGCLAASAFTPSTRLRRLGAFWLPARIATRPCSPICLASSSITCCADLDVVDAVEREALGLRRVAVERHDRHAARDGVVDRARDLAGVGARDEDRGRAFVHRLRDALRLDLAVFGRRRQPRRSRSGRRSSPTAPSPRPPRRCAPTGRPGWSSSWRSSRCGSPWPRPCRRSTRQVGPCGRSRRARARGCSRRAAAAIASANTTPFVTAHRPPTDRLVIRSPSCLPSLLPSELEAAAAPPAIRAAGCRARAGEPQIGCWPGRAPRRGSIAQPMMIHS